MIIRTEADMITFGQNFAKTLTLPASIELIGEIGVGKTTFTKGLALGLGIKEAINSPSFVISKSYISDNGSKNLIHYDFYRLEDPGVMATDLEESLADPDTITVVEWAASVKDILPQSTTKIHFKYTQDGNREVEVEG